LTLFRSLAAAFSTSESVMSASLAFGLTVLPFSQLVPYISVQLLGTASAFQV